MLPGPTRDPLHAAARGSAGEIQARRSAPRPPPSAPGRATTAAILLERHLNRLADGNEDDGDETLHELRDPAHGRGQVGASSGEIARGGGEALGFGLGVAVGDALRGHGAGGERARVGVRERVWNAARYERELGA